MITWKLISLPIITIFCALVIRFSLDIPISESDGEYYSINDIVNIPDEANKILEDYIINQAKLQSSEDLKYALLVYKQTQINNSGLILKTFEVITGIVDVIIIMMFFHIITLILRRKT